MMNRTEQDSNRLQRLQQNNKSTTNWTNLMSQGKQVVMTPEAQEDPISQGKQVVMTPEAQEDPISQGKQVVMTPEAQEDPISQGKQVVMTIAK
jgi:hypothetical protein